ncbi:MAG TPA: chemotaxis protein [Xanthomonadales bacterium]|nr:chemotaxis protein [Xanthomonadales bacterium]
MLANALHEALAALESGDEDGCRHRLRGLAGEREGAAQALARLSRELNAALGHLPEEGMDLGELPDACARLDHVVRMTEDATHRTLDLVERCRETIDAVEAHPMPTVDADALRRLRGLLGELALAQSHQDLCGQIIGRVVGLVGRIHRTLSALGFDEGRTGANQPELAGPVIAGLDRHGVSQDAADALLSDLGL